MMLGEKGFVAIDQQLPLLGRQRRKRCFDMMHVHNERRIAVDGSHRLPLSERSKNLLDLVQLVIDAFLQPPLVA